MFQIYHEFLVSEECHIVAQSTTNNINSVVRKLSQFNISAAIVHIM